MKYCHHILVSLLILLGAFTGIEAQSSNDAFRVVKASTGQTFLLSGKGGSGIIYTDICFRMGPIYEFDSISGISTVISKIINARIVAALSASGKNIKYSGTVDPEQIGFHFESSLADLDYVLSLASEKIVQAKFDQEGLDEAKTEFKADLDSLRALDSYKTESRIMKILWGNDYKKLNRFGDQMSYKNIQVGDLSEFHRRYFLPFNNTVTVLGTYSENDVLDKVQNAFKDFKSREFNPELITKVIDFKPLVNTVQLLSNGSDAGIASITFQNPGARQDRNATYCAYVLTEMINDKDGSIQKSMSAAGLKDFKAVYAENNFYGTFTISARPSGQNFADAFRRMNQLILDITQKDYFIKAEIEKAQADIEAEYKALKANDQRTFLSMVTQYRFSNDENYFPAFVDSIKAVNIDHMRGYVGDYFVDHSGVRNLSISQASLKDAAPDQQYFALDDSLSNMKFTYDLNKSDIETDEAKQNLKRIIQWMKINTDMHVQINGFADEGEFKKAYSDTVMRFIDSTATFHKAMPDAIKKGYLRIEMMRAMKIAKALYEAGITEDRITGTSMVFTSESKEAAAENRKCTLSFEKIKPRMSLYEYHFGKKKEEKQQN